MSFSSKIVLLGDPRLYQVSLEVKQKERKDLDPMIAAMHEAMMNFRKAYKRGRAIAAPQIGINKRLLYMHIDKPVVFINPEFTWKSPEVVKLWDDCVKAK